MKLISKLALALLFVSALWGQTGHDMIVPDCQLFFNFTAVSTSSTGTTPPLANYGPGSVNGPNLCTTWTIAYAVISTGTVTSLSLEVQDAPLASTTTPGTFIAYAGTVAAGVNPNISTTGAQTFLSNLTVAIPWIRVKLTALNATGTTNIIGILQGWNTGHSGSSSTVVPTNPCAGTIASPCIVAGPDANGAVPTKSPVQVSGWDGTDIRTLKTDALGGLGTASYNGTAYQQNFACTHQQLFNLATATDVVIVTGTAAQTTRLCHVSFSGDTSVTATIQQGTGTTCGTSTAALTGGYVNILGFAFDFSSLSPLLTTATGRDMCLHLSAAATGGGVAIYATY